ncbi:MAG: hypothetical protein ACTSRP_24690 [Candidatus Helarchaeota archaeon]
MVIENSSINTISKKIKEEINRISKDLILALSENELNELIYNLKNFIKKSVSFYGKKVKE